MNRRDTLQTDMVRRLHGTPNVTTRPSTKLFHVGGLTKAEKPADAAPRPRQASVSFEFVLDDDASPGVTAEAWHKARGWASED
jgi:hypothetical protein